MKIKIKSKGFPTVDYGFLEANKEYNVSNHFAKYCIEKMKSAEPVNTTKKRTSRKVKAK